MKRLLLLEIILIGIVFPVLSFRVDCKFIIKQAELALSRLEKRPFLSFFGIVIIAIVVRIACLSFFPSPQPQIHDEFSYLLAADTFVKGRLANPTHLYWQSFESFHINQIPSYASMYPPAQGLVLAAGIVLGGNAWLGVLVSTAVMCGVLGWMLHGWLPFRWAAIGGMIGVVRIALFSYWGNSYWGGSVAAIGGLFVLGSLPRLVKKNSSINHFLTLSFGILILANSRPYEGLVLCVAIALAAFVTYVSSRLSLAERLTPKWLVVVLIMTIGFAAMAFYNWRVTGNPFLLPYKVNQQQYAMVPPFLWRAPSTNTQYRHEIMKKFYAEYLPAAVRARTSITGFLDLASEKLTITWLFFIGPVLSVPLIALPKAIFDRRMRFLVLVAIFAVPGIFAETWFHAHYGAPFTGIIYVLILQSLRHICFSRSLSRQSRHALFLTVPIVIILMTVVAVITFPPSVQGRAFGTWCCNPNGESERSRLISQLTAMGGRHLVLVEYTSDHSPHDEWVYNPADIDGSPIVFARHIDSGSDSNLIKYFEDRRVWRLVVDDRPLRLEPYRAP
jgi:hypothetical protein